MPPKPRKTIGRPGITSGAELLIPPLPVYSAQTIASVHTGIPITVFRAAKAAGCPAFVSNKVSLRPFLEWYFKEQREHGGNHRERKEKADADLAEIKVEQARGNLVAIAAVEKWAETVFVSLRQGILASTLLETEKDELLTNLQRLIDEPIGSPGAVADDAPLDAETDAAPEDDGSGVGGHVPIPAEGE